MKKLLQIALLSTALLLLSTNLFASDPPPPPPGHGQTGNVPGGGAPLGSGLAVLLACGAGYAALKKKYKSEDIEF